MGLDMYLRATKYVSGYDFSKDNCDFYNKLLKFVGIKRTDLGDPETPIASVNVNVAYWRKSNAIHSWFVDNCQNGKDDCRRSYVSREQLVQLRDLCQKVLDNPGDAASLLATRSGFFFGSVEYDDWFFDDIRNTVKMLNVILNNKAFEGWGFEYKSSW